MGVDTISTGTRFYGIALFRPSVGERICGNLHSPEQVTYVNRIQQKESLTRGCPKRTGSNCLPPLKKERPVAGPPGSLRKK
jgi:hypothetical protein